MFFWLYKYLPVRRVRTTTAWVAAVFTAVMFELAKLAFSFYVASFNPASLYTGTLAAVVGIVAWVYYAAQQQVRRRSRRFVMRRQQPVEIVNHHLVRLGGRFVQQERKEPDEQQDERDGGEQEIECNSSGEEQHVVLTGIVPDAPCIVACGPTETVELPP